MAEVPDSSVLVVLYVNSIKVISFRQIPHRKHACSFDKLARLEPE